MSKIFAPFTEEQVKNLNIYQDSWFHPFTCCGHNGCKRREHNDGILIATTEGWICPCGKYKQDWAHAGMAEPLPENPFNLFFNNE